MNRSDELERERRGWHLGKEIPVAVLFAILGIFTAGITGYNKVQNSIATLGDSSVETVRRLNELSIRVQDGRIPAELNAARISVIEANVGELKARVAELERRR